MLGANQATEYEILSAIRDRYSTVTAFAKQHDARREVVYQAAKGKGSRAIRLAIAQLMDCVPSNLWSDDTLARLRDDRDYAAIKKGGVSN